MLCLAVADLMAGDNAQTNQESGKPALTTTSAICYLLKNAATVDEALELLRGIDMHSDIGAAPNVPLFGPYVREM